ncbi:DUF5991 domain-containing protein [Sphingosinicella sp. BN140058]|uniref:DUF5991 domain-containing protein n=1 Tax=Sphingosinicella sp. BN140058 TaxID=1892855 RepID=UPI00101378E8|nr:DUF5991 domain-containing protein [Sphingosinicella sp. BN140058]QAY77969.1 hypothetical protein ETR14_16635 [Sphingosinicella sp. BN140058]
MTSKLPFAVTAFAAALSAATPAAAAPLSTWYGRYAYSESLGRIGGAPGEGPAAFVDHVLTIGRNGCTLTRQGFQTNQRIRCTVTPQGQSAIVKFYAFDSGAARGPRFSRGQPLLTLTRSGPRLLTRWQGVTRMDGTRPTQVAFRRQ